jgi:cis-L-3-hydroxyproline dehydratase
MVCTGGAKVVHGVIPTYQLMPAASGLGLQLSPQLYWAMSPAHWIPLAKRVAQPIMLDECLHTFDDHLEAWRLGACEGAKVNPNRVGSLTKARQIRDFGLSVGWQMHMEDLGGSALADTAAIHLASSTPRENRLASWLSHHHLAVDPVAGQGARNVDGFATPPVVPGLGFSPDVDILGEPAAVYG